MADSNRTGQRLLDSIRKAKAGDEAASKTPAAVPAASAASPEPGEAPAPKTSVRKASAKKAPARKTAAKKAPAKKAEPKRGTTARRSATTAAPYPMFATERPQPAAYPGAPAEHDPYRSPGRVWPD
ncbi:MAG: hypothetical protein PVJ47_07825 [Thiohalocapsa sp.]|jgi:hypothetical protein